MLKHHVVLIRKDVMTYEIDNSHVFLIQAKKKGKILLAYIRNSLILSFFLFHLGILRKVDWNLLEERVLGVFKHVFELYPVKN